MPSPRDKTGNLLVQLGVAALSGSAIGAILSKFSTIDDLRTANPRLYDMLIGAGVIAAHEGLEQHEERPFPHQMPPPGYMP